MNAYRKLTRIERYGSNRTKVFAKRARKAGWSAEGIVAAIKFGIERFRPL